MHTTFYILKFLLATAVGSAIGILAGYIICTTSKYWERKKFKKLRKEQSGCTKK